MRYKQPKKAINEEEEDDSEDWLEDWENEDYPSEDNF